MPATSDPNSPRAPRVTPGRGDEIVYAQRVGRTGLTRFVKNRSLEPCSTLFVLLMRDKGGAPLYVCLTAFIGRRAELEPWDPRATPASREFWSREALIWGSEPIIRGTETDQCPW